MVYEINTFFCLQKCYNYNMWIPYTNTYTLKIIARLHLQFPIYLGSQILLSKESHYPSKVIEDWLI